MELAHEEPNYMKVFGWLVVLTAIEVAIVYLHLPKALLASALILLALAKAFLVAWYFMHLKNEKVVLIASVVLSLSLLGVLFLGLMPDVARKLF